MGEKKVIVAIHPDGKVEQHTEGFAGESCVVATKDLNVILNGKLEESGKTAEYYQNAPDAEAFITGLNK